MLDELAQLIRDNDLVRPGELVLVAVSGGADSMALLHLLRDLSGELGIGLRVAHLDHRLRAESASDARFVADVCRQLAIPCDIAERDVGALAAETGEGVEAAGRMARREFLEQVARDRGCQRIALAHHADDQAETVLFRLLRGSGASGLAAMRLQDGPYIRPLLPFRAARLRACLEARDIDWREDASNLDRQFSRNRIRHELMPQLRSYNPRVDDALCRLAGQLAAEEDFWAEQVDRFLDRHLVAAEGSFELPVDELLSVHPALRARLVRAVLQRLRGDLLGIEAGHLEQVERLLGPDAASQAETHLPSAWVARRYDRLRFATQAPRCPDYQLDIEGPGRYPLPGGETLVVSLAGHATQGRTDAAFDPEAVTFPLTVRPPRAGDRFVPSGMTGRKLLKDYFIDVKLPLESRRRVPVVLAAGTILWLAGHRRCEGGWPRADAQVLQIHLESAKNGDV